IARLVPTPHSSCGRLPQVSSRFQSCRPTKLTHAHPIRICAFRADLLSSRPGSGHPQAGEGAGDVLQSMPGASPAMTLTVDLSTELIEALRALAGRNGQDL